MIVVFAFCDYTGPGGSVSAHIKAFRKAWASRDIFAIVWDYVFVTLRAKLLIGKVDSRNFVAAGFCERLGMRPCGRIIGYFPSSDLLVYHGNAVTLSKWARHGKTERAAPPSV